MTPLVPLDLPVDTADAAEGAGHAHDLFEPLLGLGTMALIVAILVVAYLLLRRRGLVPAFAMPAFVRTGRPEDAARQILAERFAHGDLSSEEFMERASALNWTPGVDVARPRPLGR